MQREGGKKSNRNRDINRVEGDKYRNKNRKGKSEREIGDTNKEAEKEKRKKRLRDREKDVVKRDRDICSEKETQRGGKIER
jgi:hypothetical protein